MAQRPTKTTLVPTLLIEGPRDGETYARPEADVRFAETDIDQDRGVRYVYEVDLDDPTRAYFTGEILLWPSENPEPVVFEFKRGLDEFLDEATRG